MFIHKVGEVSSEAVIDVDVNFHSSDVTLPESMISAFLERKSWSVVESRLYVSCKKLRQNNLGSLLDITLVNDRGENVKIPVIEVKGERRNINKSFWSRKYDQCATNIVFTGSNRFEIGHSVLEAYDVAFDLPQGSLRFVVPDSSRAAIGNIYQKWFPSSRFELNWDKMPSWNWDAERDGFRFEFMVSTYLVNENQFYVKSIPYRNAADPKFEFFCMGQKCKDDVNKLFGFLNAKWIGFPIAWVDPYDNDISVKENHDSLVRELHLQWDGDRVVIRAVVTGHRASIDMDSFIDGERMVFRPTNGGDRGTQFHFQSWPPVVDSSGTIPLVNRNEVYGSILSAIHRWKGNPIIKLNNDNSVTITSDESGSGNLLANERKLKVDSAGLCFDQSTFIRYCLVEEGMPSSRNIRLVPQKALKNSCRFLFKISDIDGVPKLDLRGSTGRFALHLPSSYDLRLPQTIAGIDWIGDPGVTFNGEDGSLVIAPSSTGPLIAYDLVTPFVEGKYYSVIEFVAKRPRFIVKDANMLENNILEFPQHRGQFVTGEFILSLDSNDRMAPIGFTRQDDGVLELLLYKVMPFSRKSDNGDKEKFLFANSRTKEWYGIPEIRISSNGQLVISSMRSSGHVYRVDFKWVSDTDMALQFIPVRDSR